MIKSVLTDSGSGKALHTDDYGLSDDRILVVTDPAREHGVFKTTAYTVQGTTEQVSTPDLGSISLTDLIVTFEKKANGIVTINFHDGTNTVPLFKATLTDAPCNLAINFSGRWQGWQAAHIDVTISGADSVGNVAIGYVRYPQAGSLSYSAWNALR